MIESRLQNIESTLSLILSLLTDEEDDPREDLSGNVIRAGL